MNRGSYQSVNSYGGGGGGSYGGGGGGSFGGGGYGGGGGGYSGGGGYGGGGGYSGGGGGFIQGSQGFTSPGISPGPGGKGGRSRNQSITHVTSAQLVSADEVQEGIFHISGKEVNMVCLIGEVMEVTTSPTNVVYNVDDRTGPWVKVQKWMSDQEPGEQEERMTIQEGMYIKAHGHLKVFNKQKSITAFGIEPITDFNELSHHLSEIMYAHLTSTKGPPVPEQFRQRGGGQQQMATGGWGAPMATSTQMGGGGGSYYSGSRQDNSMTPLQQHVLNVISSCPNDQGINVNEVVDNMKKHGHADGAVKNAIEFLCTEGHIYSTIDDFHYKSTDA